MSATTETVREFHCPRWPGCQCPEGTIARDCPGRTVTAASEKAPRKWWDGNDWVTDWDEPTILPASSGSGGPAGAPKASPAAPADDPDGVVTAFRDAMPAAPRPMPPLYRVAGQQPASTEDRIREAAAARRGRSISGETLINDINALLARGDRALIELSAIQCELAMIRKDMGELFGLPTGEARKAE